MRPPICVICHTDFRHSTKKGEMIEFKLSEKDKEYNQRFKQKGFVGHPAGKEWFCGKHIEAARKYQHLTLSEAIERIKNPISPTQLTIKITPTYPITLFTLINKNLSSLSKLLNISGDTKPILNQKKKYTPIDGCQPPFCPFTLEKKQEISTRDIQIISRYEANYWNEDKLANASLHLFVSSNNSFLFSVSGYSQEESEMTDSLLLRKSNLKPELENKLETFFKTIFN